MDIPSSSRPNKALELARMMIKQAIMLKKSGLVAEARALARRAWDMNVIGHGADRLDMVPVRVRRNRR